jgi:hypothetical protein
MKHVTTIIAAIVAAGVVGGAAGVASHFLQSDVAASGAMVAYAEPYLRLLGDRRRYDPLRR